MMTWLVNQGSLPMLETFDPYISSIFPKTPKKGVNCSLLTCLLVDFKLQTLREVSAGVSQSSRSSRFTWQSLQAIEKYIITST